jgi:hypothetical protein
VTGGSWSAVCASWAMEVLMIMVGGMVGGVGGGMGASSSGGGIGSSAFLKVGPGRGSVATVWF